MNIGQQLWEWITKQKFLAAGIAVILLVALATIARNALSYEIVNFPNDGEGIVLFGDSLAAGVGAQNDRDLAFHLSELVEEPVTTLGVPGETTTEALARIDRLPENTRLVIIISGGNDVLKKVDREITLTNMRTMIAEVQSQGSIVAIASVKSTLLGSGTLHDQYQTIAAQTGAIYLGNMLDGIFGDENLMADTIHPNSAGYNIIAERFSKELQSYLATSQ